jgi:hypothetical protein
MKNKKKEKEKRKSDKMSESDLCIGESASLSCSVLLHQ